MEEVWEIIPEFPNYQISNLGHVYNVRGGIIMRTSLNNYGHVKITLKYSGINERATRSVARLVAEAFIEPPNWMCDEVIILDGDFSNVEARNLAWRPKSFAWKYTHQMRTDQPRHYWNLVIHNITTDYYYNSIIEAGMTEGLLFDYIWQATYSGEKLFPYGHRFEVVERV